MSHDFNRWRSSGDLPTPPYGHPCLVVFLFCGVFIRGDPRIRKRQDGEPQNKNAAPKRGFFHLIMIPNFAMMHRSQRISLRHPSDIHRTIHNPMIVAFHPADDFAF
jgi:hypothetical protein